MIKKKYRMLKLGMDSIASIKSVNRFGVHQICIMKSSIWGKKKKNVFLRFLKGGSLFEKILNSFFQFFGGQGGCIQ